MSLAIDGLALRGGGMRWLLTGKTLDAANTIGKPAGVTIRESKVARNATSVMVPPTSAAIYELAIAKPR
jgi:alpha-N-arabinofuranosidase